MSPFVAAERGYIDEVIMPHSTPPHGPLLALRHAAPQEFVERPWRQQATIFRRRR